MLMFKLFDSLVVVMKIFVFLLILVFLVAGCVTREVTPNPSGGGVVEKAYGYCAQFSESTCNANQYLTDDYFEPINCYWNSKVGVCWAGIGYQ